MRKRRQFSPEFKAQVVLDLLTGQHTPAEACRKHALSPPLVATWRAAVQARASTVVRADDRRDEEHARIAELERMVGRLTMEAEVLKKASTLLAGAPTGGGRRP